ncbi:Zn-ribbon domain-containing OB-fold protein [Frankia tisae]|uniref:Zn-ribbon domain-containing OB-fold protein n=1 Tax=Frankia tisae TaxID=2950104 RepID=UPI0021C0B99B|nr:Zn-ribbon domain-containing OB-fold protein [Frankia tisae]
MTVPTTVPTRIPGEWHIPYQYTIGTFATAFFDALREQRILGCRCAQCGRVSVPPKSFCEYCFVPIDELVEVGDTGRIEAVTVVTAPFAGSPPVPYVVAYVRLAGATSSICNYVRGVDLGDLDRLPADIAIEAPVRAVFGDKREGRVTDFWFEPVRDRS